MARNVPNHPSPKTEDQNPHSPRAPMAGGALGMPGEQHHETNAVATAIGGRRVAPAPHHEPREDKPPREFRVVDGPRRRNGDGQLQSHITVMYEGCLTTVHPGKVYAEHQIDLDVLRRQGVRFEELKPAEAAEA